VFDSQTEWARLLLASLRDAGVSEVVISPGSRSTPLVWAACETPGLRCRALIDERSAGFFALGQARVSGTPSLLICTSGTAASHYYPAVIEARESGTPLLVLSADRPLELMHSGAHQTIDQTRLFGAYAGYHELPAPAPDQQGALALRRIAWQAVSESLEAPRGAVHLNFRAKKPLEPQPGTGLSSLPTPVALAPALRPRALLPTPLDLDWVLGALRQAGCPMLICGSSSLADSPSAALVRRFAELTGSIVCVESVSQLRFQLDPTLERGLLCDSYDWLLGSAALRPRLRPDFVLQVGGAPVSAELARLLQSPPADFRLAICAESGWPDSLYGSAQIVRSRPRELLEALCERLSERPRANAPQLELWRSAQRLARRVVDQHAAGEFGEAAAVHDVVERLPPGSLLCIGNSLAPRLLDRYCGARARHVDICSQRGTSGIEGTLAGALGAASRATCATTLLVGDVAFLHDVGSLWATDPARTGGPPFNHPVVLIVLNNQGGRIFEQLPIARDTTVDMRWWTTPHSLSAQGAAAMYGVPFASAANRADLATALEAAYALSGPSLIEIVLEPDSASRSLVQLGSELEPSFAALV
jgi:2-succinyl-5-enolpyruvyl-6-hydroxy-3-cyclohexene-1-carboxylate synthase